MFVARRPQCDVHVSQDASRPSFGAMARVLRDRAVEARRGPCVALRMDSAPLDAPAPPISIWARLARGIAIEKIAKTDRSRGRPCRRFVVMIESQDLGEFVRTRRRLAVLLPAMAMPRGDRGGSVLIPVAEFRRTARRSKRRRTAHRLGGVNSGSRSRRGFPCIHCARRPDAGELNVSSFRAGRGKTFACPLSGKTSRAPGHDIRDRRGPLDGDVRAARTTAVTRLRHDLARGAASRLYVVGRDGTRASGISPHRRGYTYFSPQDGSSTTFLRPAPTSPTTSAFWLWPRVGRRKHVGSSSSSDRRPRGRTSATRLVIGKPPRADVA